jgi:hypothetical protein
MSAREPQTKRRDAEERAKISGEKNLQEADDLSYANSKFHREEKA